MCRRCRNCRSYGFHLVSPLLLVADDSEFDIILSHRLLDMGYVNKFKKPLAQRLTYLSSPSWYMHRRIRHLGVLLWPSIWKEEHVCVHHHLFFDRWVVGQHVAGCGCGHHDEYPRVSFPASGRVVTPIAGLCFVWPLETTSSRQVSCPTDIAVVLTTLDASSTGSSTS